MDCNDCSVVRRATAEEALSTALNHQIALCHAAPGAWPDLLRCIRSLAGSCWRHCRAAHAVITHLPLHRHRSSSSGSYTTQSSTTGSSSARYAQQQQKLPWGLLGDATGISALTMRADQLGDFLAGPPAVLQLVKPRVKRLKVLECKDTALIQELLVTLVQLLPQLEGLHVVGPVELHWPHPEQQPALEQQQQQLAEVGSQELQQQQQQTCANHQPLSSQPEQQQQQELSDPCGPAPALADEPQVPGATSAATCTHLKEVLLEGCQLDGSAIAWLQQQLHLTALRVTPGADWVTTLKGLQYLDLSGTRMLMFGDLPQGIEQLQGLHTLCASNLRLTALPEGLTALQQLQALDLSGHRLTSQQLEVLSELQDLTSIDLSHRSHSLLQQLPASFPALPNLQRLRVVHQHLQDVPLHLTALTHLDITGCNLRPKGGRRGLGQLSQLQVLYMGNCRAGSLAGLAGLTRLQRLDVSNNKLVNLVGLGQLPQLQYLNIARNKLKTLRHVTHLGPLEDISCLVVGSNPLSNPTQIAKHLTAALPRLVSLDLSHIGLTELRQLGDWCSQAPRLQQLVLAGNPLPSLPGVESLPQQLTHLDVSSCDLSDVPAGLTVLTDIQELILADNSLEELPMMLSELRQLEYLDVWRCRLPNPRAPKVLRHLQSIKKVRRDKSTLYHLPKSLEHLVSWEQPVFTR